jgi:hypothetical protein
MQATRSGILAAGVALVLAATAHADVIIFTDEAEFLAQTRPGFYRETFVSLPDGINASPLNFSNNGFDYEANSLSLFVVRSHPPVKWVSPGFAQDSIDIHFTSGNVTALGGHFFNTQINGDVGPGLFLLNLSDGTSVTLNDPTPTTFRGFISSSPITSILITPDPRTFATITDFIVGAAVPEPSSLALALTGTALVVFAGCWSRPRAR